MARKSAAGASTKPTTKSFPAKKTAAKAAAVRSSARKAASGKRNTGDKENCSSVTAATSVPASVGDMHTGARVAEPVVVETNREPSPVTDNITSQEDNNRGYKKSAIQVVKRAVAEHLRKEAEEEAARKYLEETDRIERPKKIGNLRVAMSLDAVTYRKLCADLARYAVGAGLESEVGWSNQSSERFSRVCNTAKKKYGFLKKYVADWPIKEYLMAHFRNKRSYRRRKERKLALEDMAREEAMATWENLSGFGTDDGNSNGNE